MARSLQELRAALRIRLEARWPEIEETIVTRVYAIGDPFEARDPAYAENLRATLSAAIRYGLDVIELGEERAPAVPAELLAQARMAAENGVPLDTIARRYWAGYSILIEFAVKEAEDGGLFGDAGLQRVLRGKGAFVERLIAAVSVEYERALRERATSAERRLARRIDRLLDGEVVDDAELPFDFDAHHVAAIAGGPGAWEAVRELATLLDTGLVRIRREDGTLEAWLESHRGIDPNQLARLVRTPLPSHAFLALGEPARGYPGWRFTHRQARDALSVARHRPGAFTRYSNFALLAGALRDEVLAATLHQVYLAPLESARDGGAALRASLRAYFAAGQQVASASEALAISRQTVTTHLRIAEERIGRSLKDCAAELQTALQLQELADKKLFNGPWDRQAAWQPRAVGPHPP